MIRQKLWAVALVALMVGSFAGGYVAYAVTSTCNSGVTFGKTGVGLPCFTGGNPSPLPAKGSIWYDQDKGCVAINDNGFVKCANNPEGNWTSWSLYSTSLTFGSARAFYVGISDNGSVLFLEDFSGGASFYNLNSKTLVSPGSHNVVSNDGVTDHSAYGEYVTLVNSSSKSVLMFKGGNLVQNLTDATYNWSLGGFQYPGASLDPTGRWLVVAGVNVTGNFLWFFQGVGTP